MAGRRSGPLADRVRIAILLNNLGYLAFQQGEYSAARALHEESLTIRRELDDSGGIAYSLSGLADVALQQGDYAAAGAFSRDALAIRISILSWKLQAGNLHATLRMPCIFFAACTAATLASSS